MSEPYYRCQYPDVSCTAPSVDGTAYCVLHLGVMRARKVAELLGEDEEVCCAVEGTSDIQREAVGQKTLFGTAA